MLHIYGYQQYECVSEKDYFRLASVAAYFRDNKGLLAENIFVLGLYGNLPERARLNILIPVELTMFLMINASRQQLWPNLFQSPRNWYTRSNPHKKTDKFGFHSHTGRLRIIMQCTCFLAQQISTWYSRNYLLYLKTAMCSPVHSKPLQGRIELPKVRVCSIVR